ncbi:hypothetical protein CONPUDRAFT_54287 [Coniophora puteana RWD-64-598 SS2]|uniref:SWR1-complex protein 4 n=1 Tax=Coniophora puteana (strain RWD-64-598) TaxID=741705 RepID=A0A5M3MT46_CONPW|nr:uncharacterized protein CONPUDRAFT_54287 [Coniophora puteana RWD-64-598 SS2]EIW82342.1 hypothetical protein CONPUDRAFT_54287 [Coniophora puteana RWD-64-598 SS2]
MAVSASDIRSALSLPGPSNPGPTSQPPVKKPAGTSTKKPEGISRELFALIGPSAPSLAAQLAKPRLKQKPNLGTTTNTKWEWRPFKNEARSDSLQLCHWVKQSSDIDDGYSFAKYNVDTIIYTYTLDEYTELLQDDNWTKEETDYLFALVKEYETRWYVVHDRYEYPGGSARSLEDIKDRYYSICRKLVRKRPWSGDETTKSQLLVTFEFDKDKETMRKKYLESLDERTQEEIAEEEALFIELKRLEQNERRFKKDRDDLLRTLLGISSGLPDVIPDEDNLSSLSIDTKKKKKGLAEVETPTSPNVISLGPPIPKRAQPVKSAAHDSQHCITRVELSASSANKSHTAAHLRSYKLPAPKAAIAPKVNQTLIELNITYARLVMPTRENSLQLESLIETTTSLLETKRLVDKLDQDIKVAKQRMGIRQSGEADEASMDVDDTHGEDAEGGRSQSVVSTKSGRGRNKAGVHAVYPVHSMTFHH